MGANIEMRDFNGDKKVNGEDTVLREKYLVEKMKLSKKEAKKIASGEMKNYKDSLNEGKKKVKEVTQKDLGNLSSGYDTKSSQYQTYMKYVKRYGEKDPKTIQHLGYVPKISTPEKAPFGIGVEIGLEGQNDDISEIYQGKQHYTDVSPQYQKGHVSANGYDLLHLNKVYSNILPTNSRYEAFREINEVHQRLSYLLRYSKPEDIQKSIIATFQNASDLQKLALANTLGDIMGQYAYDYSIYDKEGVESNTTQVFGALQQAINTGRDVPGGVCTDIHIAVSQTLSALGIESGVVSVGQSSVGHAISFFKIGNQFILSDYGKMYTGRNRDEVFEAYERENGLPSTIHYIADKDGNIIGYMRTALGKSIKSKISPQAFENYMRTGVLPQGMNITLKNNKQGVDIRKDLGKYLHVGARVGAENVRGQKLQYVIGTIGIHSKNKVLNLEANFGQTNTDFDNGKESEDQHINIKLQARKEFDINEEVMLKLAGGLEGTLSFSKNKQANIWNGERWVKVPTAPNNGEVFAYVGGEVMKVTKEGNRYWLGGVVEFTTAGNFNKFDSFDAALKSGSKLGNPKAKVYTGSELMTRYGTVSGEVFIEDSALQTTAGGEGKWLSPDEEWNAYISGSSTEGKGLFGDPGSQKFSIGGGVKTGENQHLGIEFSQEESKGVEKDSKIMANWKWNF